MRKWTVWLRDIALILLIFFAVHWWQTRDMPKDVIAPSLVGLSLAGEPMTLSDYQGQPVLVRFWATWCPICRLQDGSIASLAKDYPVITVATGSGSADEVQTYLHEASLTMPVMLDEYGKVAQNWNVHGVPATFVINSQGKVDYATTGYSTGIGLRLRLMLADYAWF